MMLAQRARAYERKFPTRPPMQLVDEGGHDVIYGRWLIGADYRNKTAFYGAYPNGFLDRVMAMFPDVPGALTLHAFSGSLPPGDYTRLDLNPDRRPDVIGSVYDVAKLFKKQAGFRLVIADPPYSAADAVKYDTPMINRGRATRALAGIVRPGGHLVWLDTVWPMFSKDLWRTVGRIALTRSTNHRLRDVTIFERTAA